MEASNNKSRFYQRTALTMVLLMVLEVIAPNVALALTSGPTQPELQSFQPVGTTQMVDLFTGDFNYNIPLMEVPGPDGGYPINLFYNSVVNPDQEASYVGLGWNLGIGAMNRQMRGLPDDFDGEQIKRRTDMKPDWTIGINSGIQPELFGFTKNGTSGINLGLGLNLMCNSYNGFGYSLDPSIGIRMGKADGLGLSSNFSMSLNSLEGASSNASLSLRYEKINDENYRGKNDGVGMNFGLSTNSRKGGLNMLGSYDANPFTSTSNIFMDLNYEQQAFTPVGKQVFTGTNISMNFKWGVTIKGATVQFLTGGFYGSRGLKNKNKNIFNPAYGAMYHENATNKSLQDFNRSNDAVIRFDQQHLAVPTFTTDILSVTGHGIGGTYQLHRSDVPIFNDPETVSKSSGGSLGVDLAFGVDAHLGLNIDLNSSIDENLALFKKVGNIGAQKRSKNEIFEPFYMKSAGELSIDNKNEDDYLGGDDLVHLDLDGFEFSDNLLKENGQVLPNIKGRLERKNRSTSVQPITNGHLLDTSGIELLPFYDVEYYNKTQNDTIHQYENTIKLDRTTKAKNKVAGYTSLTPSGARWNFALPVDNRHQEEVTFSVDRPDNECRKTVNIPKLPNGELDYQINKTDKYFDLTEVPSYAHAYLLTSVLGADYIDVDPTDGAPNDKDRGYWMVVEYVKTSDSYAWRSPFLGGMYMGGLTNKDRDDKAAYSYGEREQYHPARIITRSHVAEFSYSRRADARGALDHLQDNNTASPYGDYSYKLDKIDLFTKAELDGANDENRAAIPTQTTHFKYDYQLCPDVENNANNSVGENGKLTLKEVYFTYENNNRGVLSPYKFKYDGANTPYDVLAFDRWGINKPIISSDSCQNIYNPYVDQSSEEVQDSLVSSWHLTEIQLPSGAHLKIDIGRDHYSHEQNHVATQMFNISGVEQSDDNIGNRLVSTPNPNANQRTIYFDLNSSISNSLSQSGKEKEIDRYFTDLHINPQSGKKQLYFQINTNLFDYENLPSDVYQDVGGYVDIESYGIVEDSVDGSGNYKKGYIVVAPYETMKVKGKTYHPFALSAWQFIKLNLNDMMFGQPPGTTSATDQLDTDQAKKQGAKQFFNVWGQIVGLFKNYYQICSNRGYASELNLDRCFIRLNNPNRKVYGGGVRVNKITLHDTWSEEETPVYGTVYEYEEEEEVYNNLTEKYEKTGRMISSGTAINTPSIGKQESALRYATYYTEDFKYRSSEQHFTEFPLNEAYYPGASIGYRKVTVKSLATDYSIKKRDNEQLPTDLPADLPDGFATSGMTVTEFYTAKEFPIIERHTNIKKKINGNKQVPIPLFGVYRLDKYTGSQGYSIELNNMHGRVKKVSNYEQDKFGEVNPEPISYVEYEYLHKEEVYTRRSQGAKKRLVLENLVDVVVSDLDPNDLSKAEIKTQMEMGVQRDIFMDVRSSNNSSLSVQFHPNSDFLNFAPAVIPILSFIPAVNNSKTRIKTAVTNKVIRRNGILKKVIAYDGQSRVETENVLFDKYTGQVLLSTVNNTYDDKVYSYNIPAHFAYNRMGSAAKNWGIELEVAIDSPNCDGYYPIDITPDILSIIDHLVEGDEFILETELPTRSKQMTTLIKVDKDPTHPELLLALDNPVDFTSTHSLLLVRSGNRNQLGATVGGITALSDPTINRTTATCTQNFYGVTYDTTYQTGTHVQPYIDMLQAIINNKDLILNDNSFNDEYIFTFDPTLMGPPVSRNHPDIAEIDNAHEDWWNVFTYVCGEYAGYYINTFRWDDSQSIPGASNWGPEYIYDNQGVAAQSDVVVSGYNLVTPGTVYTGTGLTTNILNNITFQNLEFVSLYAISANGVDLKLTIRTTGGATEDYILTYTHLAGCPVQNEILIVGSNSVSPIANIPIDYRTIDNVLGISAATFSDAWDLGLDQACNPSIASGEDVFRAGKRGIYRPLSSWVYVDDRKQTAPDVNLRTDGTFDDVVLFDWASPLIFNCEAFAKWKKQSTVTKYGTNGMPIEERNIIGLYSSALYGYSDKMPVAVGGNARNTEIGFESFEEHSSVPSTVCGLTSKETGNIDFIPRACKDPLVVEFDLVTMLATDATGFAIDLPYFAGFAVPDKAVVSLQNLIGETVSFETGISSIGSYANAATGGNNMYLFMDKDVSCYLSPEDLLGPQSNRGGAVFSGTVSLYFSQPGTTCSSNNKVVDGIAHTGTKSLLLADQNPVLEQYHLQLDVNKTYVFSAWVKMDGIEHFTYADNVHAQVNNTNIYPRGPILEGWQRIEGYFTPSQGAQQDFAFIKNGTGNLYLDDIRVFPKDGSVMTYVYDPVSYRVKVVLDDNNYFTAYKYDDQGTLISTQKETPEGVKTLQETGSHVKETN